MDSACLEVQSRQLQQAREQLPFAPASLSPPLLAPSLPAADNALDASEIPMDKASPADGGNLADDDVTTSAGHKAPTDGHNSTGHHNPTDDRISRGTDPESFCTTVEGVRVCEVTSGAGGRSGDGGGGGGRVRAKKDNAASAVPAVKCKGIVGERGGTSDVRSRRLSGAAATRSGGAAAVVAIVTQRGDVSVVWNRKK